MGETVLLGAWIGFLHIGQPGQIVHAGIQGQSDAFALFEGVVALSGFDLGIVALIDAGFHLHIELRIAALFSKVF